MTRLSALAAGFAAVVLAAAAGAEAPPPPSPRFELAQVNRSCVSACQRGRQQCLDAIPTMTGQFGVRYKPANAVQQCNASYWQCRQGCGSR